MRIIGLLFIAVTLQSCGAGYLPSTPITPGFDSAGQTMLALSASATEVFELRSAYALSNRTYLSGSIGWTPFRSEGVNGARNLQGEALAAYYINGAIRDGPFHEPNYFDLGIAVGGGTVWDLERFSNDDELWNSEGLGFERVFTRYLKYSAQIGFGNTSSDRGLERFSNFRLTYVHFLTYNIMTEQELDNGTRIPHKYEEDPAGRSGLQLEYAASLRFGLGQLPLDCALHLTLVAPLGAIAKESFQSIIGMGLVYRWGP